MSEPQGTVSVRWSVQPGDDGREGALEIEWTEEGGPRLSPPQQEGFGTKLIEELVTYQLGGRVDLEFLPGGVRCEIRLPPV